MAEQALASGLIDAIQTRDAFLAQVRKEMDRPVSFDNRYGREDKPAVNLASPLAFFSLLAEMMNPPKKPQKDAVAIVYVEGAIMPGYGQASPFGSAGGAFSGDIRKALETAASDKTVKAVVLRIDSPGGSAEASETILNATRQVRARKPFIVSMGDTAASGGYYVACAADTIFADEITVTASIGVVGGKLVTADLWDRLGVNWVGYKRGANADIFNSDRPFDGPQRDAIERYMQTVYDVFKGHVTDSRGDKLTKPLDEIAGGRVYTGKQALDLGLVDRIGRRVRRRQGFARRLRGPRDSRASGLHHDAPGRIFRPGRAGQRHLRRCGEPAGRAPDAGRSRRPAAKDRAPAGPRAACGLAARRADPHRGRRPDDALRRDLPLKQPAPRIATCGSLKRSLGMVSGMGRRRGFVGWSIRPSPNAARLRLPHRRR